MPLYLLDDEIPTVWARMSFSDSWQDVNAAAAGRLPDRPSKSQSGTNREPMPYRAQRARGSKWKIGRTEEVSIMRRRRLWFTDWRLMLGIALAGVAMRGAFGYRMRWRSIGYADKANWCQLLERSCRELEAMHLKNATDNEKIAADVSALDTSTPELSKYFTEEAQKARKVAEQSREAAADCAKTAARCAALARKYERTSRYPWLGLGPDPTERLPATVTLSSDQNSPPSRK
jgi:hypothetical protein